MRSSIALAFVFAFAASDVSAAVLYKLTDNRGRVTYVDALPKDFAGTVQRMNIDTAEHVITLQEPAVRSLRTQAENEAIIRRLPVPNPSEEQVRVARLKAAAARAALESAQNNSTPDDWIYFGPGNPVGMRRAPRPEFQARLESLERDVQQAEDEVRAAERG
jgi:hypothetical protein